MPSLSPIYVSDPGYLPSIRQMALAVADDLTAYYTPYWTRAGSRALRLPLVGRELARRTLPAELAPHARRFLTLSELTRLGLARAHVRRPNYALMWRRNIEFDRRVAAAVPPDATVIAEFGGGLATFERVHGRGHSVLDYPIARLDFTQALLREEAALRPDFADTIVGPEALFNEPDHLARMTAETALADAVVVGSTFAAESFAGIVESERLRVISYGCDTTRFRPRTGERPPGPLRVLFAGQLTQRKGIAYVLDALAQLAPERFELTVVGPVIGSGRGLSRYEGRFHHVTGMRPQDMPEVFCAADVLVLPSLSEGSAVVVYEALASGLPAIVTPNAGADAVRDGSEGFVVPIRNAAVIAERLERLEADPDLLARLGRAARLRAEQYDWQAFRGRFRHVVADVQADGSLAPAETLEAVR